jgi:S1-C subfamily serine protease
MKKAIKLLSIALVCLTLLCSCALQNPFGTNYKQITNDIFTKYIEMNVAVITTHTNSEKSYDSQGSGVIYAMDDTYYYCLTNAHVVNENPDYPETTYKVFDCYGSEYRGTLLNSDISCDLAVIRFVRGGEELCVASLAEKDPKRGEEVITISTSNGMYNAVTYGKIKKIEPVELNPLEGDAETNVTFPVIWHTAPMYSGGSGSVLLNTDMELVGINYATGTNKNGGFLYGFAVSVTHVRSYLETNNLMMQR